MGQVITLKLYGRIAFVTEGQTPVTNGLEVGIAVVVTFLLGLWTTILRQFAQSFLELVTMVAGQRQLRTVFQDDTVFSMKPGL